jgi:hypothetical protein
MVILLKIFLYGVGVFILSLIWYLAKEFLEK